MIYEAKYTVWVVNPAEANPNLYVDNGHNNNMETQGWFKLYEASIEVEVPPRNEMIPAIVSGLEKKIQEHYATCEANVKELKEEIGKLLALEHHEE